MRKFQAFLAVWMTLFIGPPRSSAGPVGPTFTKDIAPILYKNCAGCHRPGEIAPMSLLDYQSARPWAKAIRQAVLSRKMPPWFADPTYGAFANDPRLSDQEISTIKAWVDSGSPEGDARDLAAEADVRGRVETRQAGHRHRYRTGLHGAAGQRCLRVFHGSDELHGRQVDSGGADPAGKPSGRASRACQSGLDDNKTDGTNSTDNCVPAADGTVLGSQRRAVAHAPGCACRG